MFLATSRALTDHIDIAYFAHECAPQYGLFQMLESLTEASKDQLQEETKEFMKKSGYLKYDSGRNHEIAQKLALKWIASSTSKLPFFADWLNGALEKLSNEGEGGADAEKLKLLGAGMVTHASAAAGADASAGASSKTADVETHQDLPITKPPCYTGDEDGNVVCWKSQ